MGSLNGGIINPQREHLKLGQAYYRFVSCSIKPEYKAGGVWWFDADTLNNMYARYREIGGNPRTPHSTASGPAATVFREWLALTFEWNEIEEIVITRLEARMDAYSGFGRLAVGAGQHPGDFRAYGMAPHLQNRFTIKQLCVPEVWLHQAKAFPRHRIVPFSQIEAVVSGSVNV